MILQLLEQRRKQRVALLLLRSQAGQNEAEEGLLAEELLAVSIHKDLECKQGRNIPVTMNLVLACKPCFVKRFSRGFE